jgi:hypothetical protein
MHNVTGLDFELPKTGHGAYDDSSANGSFRMDKGSHQRIIRTPSSIKTHDAITKGYNDTIMCIFVFLCFFCFFALILSFLFFDFASGGGQVGSTK